MQRRSFLRLTVAVPGLPCMLPFAAAASCPDGPPRRKVLVRDGADSTNQPFELLDAIFTVKVSGKDTQGRCVIFDTLRRSSMGPALHLHTDLDEWFYVLSGEFKFQAGEELLRLQAGDTLFVPQGMAHAFVKVSKGPARLLVMHQPAGTMEEYFRMVSKLPDQRLESRRALAEKHGMRFLGPPLTPND